LLKALHVSQGRKSFQNQQPMKLFEEFFAVGFRMPPHPVLTDILVKFHVQIHQLTPNAFTQFSKYFWAVMSFDGKPSGDGFVKCYELHYQPKKVVANRGEKYQ
jgi:hypothetical protein